MASNPREAGTLGEALQTAHSYWEAKGPSSRMMAIRANACAEAIGCKTKLDALTRSHGAKVLTALRIGGKSKGSIAAYYAAFRRAIELGGGNCRDWPKADTPPRRSREPFSEADLERLAVALEGRAYWFADPSPSSFVIQTRKDGTGLCRCGGWETHDLLELLRGTGMRVEVEALRTDAWQWNSERKTLHITGKGGHERTIPVERPETVALLNSPERVKRIRKLSYSGHLKRWNLAVERLHISTAMPTPHAVRHYYATRAYAQSGKDLKLVQELLGHADISTTARYLGVDIEAGRGAVG